LEKIKADQKAIMKNSMLKCALVAAVSLALLPTGFAQGSLTPPGPPAPTMKSLDQIEPRTIVNAVNTPGDAGDMFIISQPGSYYLTTNLVATGNQNGITILTNNVILDLNGFDLQGGGGGGSGVYILYTQYNITVRNGSLSGWGDYADEGGVDSESSSSANIILERLNVFSCNVGLDLFGVSEVVRDCTAYNNFGSGIYCQGGVVSGCTANNNGYAGIYCNSATVSDCSAQYNFQIGIDCYYGTVSHCTASYNDEIGIYISHSGNICDCTASYNGQGIYLDAGIVATCTIENNNGSGIGTGNGCVVKECTVAANHSGGITTGNDAVITGCAVSGNTGAGIAAGAVCKVADCVAGGNSGAGITTSDHAQITGCHVNGNNSGGIKIADYSLVRDNMVDYQQSTNTTTGIYATGSLNRIEGNSITRCGIGLKVGSSENLILRNSVSGSTGIAYSIVAGNSVGVIVAPTSSGAISGSSGGGIGSTDPTANFAF